MKKIVLRAGSFSKEGGLLYRSSLLVLALSFLTSSHCRKIEGRGNPSRPGVSSTSEMMRMISEGADVSLTDAEGKTLLHHLGSGELAEKTPEGKSFFLELVSRGAGLDVRDKAGNTPLHYAARSGNIVIASELIHHGASVLLKNQNSETAAFGAVSYITAGPGGASSLDMIRLLFQAGADIHTRNAEGKNLLHASKNPAVSAWLIEHGVDFRQRDNSGRTAFDYSAEEIRRERDALLGEHRQNGVSK